MIFGNFLKKTPKMFGGNYETAYICNIFSCRDDNAYSLVKSSLVFVLVLVLRCEHQNFFLHHYAICHHTMRLSVSTVAPIFPHTESRTPQYAIRDDRVHHAGWSWHDKAVRQRTAAPSDD